jgi:general stress protein YciG
MSTTNDGKSKRGFASMDPEKRREIARKGGASVPAEKRAFSSDKALAAVAGKKGGSAIAKDKRSFSKDRALAAHAGRKGAIGRRLMRSTALAH